MHVSFSFLSRDRITVEPDAHNVPQRKQRRAASLVVLPSAKAHWDLKFGHMMRIGVPYLRRYIATVEAIELRHNIFFASRTIHGFIPFLSRCP